MWVRMDYSQRGKTCRVFFSLAFMARTYACACVWVREHLRQRNVYICGRRLSRGRVENAHGNGYGDGYMDMDITPPPALCDTIMRMRVIR